MLRNQIKRWFRDAIQLDPNINPDLKRTLLREDHLNLNRFLDNMCAEFEGADKLLRKKGLHVKLKTMQDTTYDMAKIFAAGVEAEAKRRYESDLAKAARQAEADQIKEFEDVLAGKPTGEFAEAGVISNEEIDNEREAALEARDRALKAKI